MKKIVFRTRSLIFICFVSILFLNCFEWSTKNNPPEQPQMTCDYSVLDSVKITVVSHDLDGDKVAYRLNIKTNMGTGFRTPPDPYWTSYITCGIPITFILDLSFPYTYYITAQAKDINDVGSIWSEADTIIVDYDLHE